MLFYLVPSLSMASRNTPEDFLLFNSDLAINSSVALLGGALCYGVFLALSLTALHTLGQRTEPQARPTRILRWTIVFLLCSFTLSVSLQAASYMLLIRWPRNGSSNLPLKVRYAAGQASFMKLFKPVLVLQPVPYIVADAVPIWRAYILWSASRKARMLLVTVCIINMVFFVTISILAYLAFSVDGLHKMSPYVYPAQLAFSTTTNGIVTIAIGIRAWHIREQTKELRRTSSSSAYILIVMVEAGALLCFTQILNLTMAVLSIFFGQQLLSPCLLAASVFSVFGDTVAAAYPALIVIVFSFRGSMLDATNISPGTLYRSDGNALERQQGVGGLTTIQFATEQSPTSRIASNSTSLHEDQGKKEK
ncbi:hypothetical protein DL96DRAFT_1615411 [Flagelloscypha sp. PMI_526]|nr:hypothetical protein DL96DRAFT_1615411 [Flagelloscypha sp. PMI_526]